jgi:iron complex outermembrane receptor protein
MIFLWLTAGPVLCGQGSAAGADTLDVVFDLGEVTEVGRENHPLTLTVEAEALERIGQTSVAGALARLPGLNLVQLGPKNEFMVTVRGFDLRQVPVYLDGVPVYVSYDGYADLARFLVSNLSRITVTREETSLLAGPNAMGGAINLVSRKPARGFGFDAASAFAFDSRGYGGLSSSINAGNRGEKFYFQVGVGLVSMKPFIRSGRMDGVDPGEPSLQPNSQHEDVNASLKAGFTPNDTDHYAVSFHFQDGFKGVPPYTGDDPGQRVRYWQFPEIRKTGVHLNTKTGTGKRGSIQTRWYYDDYFNRLKSFDDSTCTTQEDSSSFTSLYDDETLGGTVIYSREMAEKHALRIALHGIYDHHREGNTSPREERVRHFIDLTGSAGAEDDYRISDRLRLVAGAGIQFKQNIRADDYLVQADSAYPFPGHDDLSFNLLAGLRYDPGEGHRLSLNLSRKSRFPTMKDRYSYRLGKSVPNPELQAEYAWNTDLGYAYAAGEVMLFRTALFYSRLQNTIQPVHGVDPDNPAAYQYQNTGEARYYGWEIGFDWMPLNEIGIGIQYTFTERENLSQPEIHFTDVPGHSASGYFGYTLFRMLDVRFDGLYNSSRTSTSDGLWKTDPFFILDFSLAFRVQSYSLEAAICNLLDRDYSYMEGYPAPGRQFKFGFRTSIRDMKGRDR